MRARKKTETGANTGKLVQALDRIIGTVLPQYTALVLVLVFCVVAIVGSFVMRDLETANTSAENMYRVSVQGLLQVGEMQYFAQETRRATLYALTTNDSNLQLDYADQTRDADRQVTRAIADYRHEADMPGQVELANRLSRDWAEYLSIRDEVLASILEGSTKEAVTLDLSGGVPSFERVKQDLNEVRQLYDQQASQRLANVVATSRRSALRLIGTLGFTFLLSMGAVWAIQRSRMLGAIQLAKLQMDFVASVSHELRTPLAVLNSAADNIADGLVTGKTEIQRYGAMIRNQSRQMNELVEQILLFASADDRSERYVFEPLTVNQILDAVEKSTKELVDGSGVVIERRVEPDLPPVMGDLPAIILCLRNLVGNAVKYGSSENKWIGLTASRGVSANRTHEEVLISVSDRGMGIDRLELAHIFDPFYRSPRVVNMQIHGTGLGLSLAKRIAETMGGDLTVVSEISVGSSFTLHLPALERNEVEMRPASAQPTSLPQR
ncbi:MAG TPA: ATP-binding protein [Methylomirabilota bacterium]|nr:ATP-binding protein [Methylomirabilota bacterium]